MSFQSKPGAVHGQRGKGLQTLIDYTNRQYKNKGWADIREVPVPFQITGTGRRKGERTGYVKKGEWVDYVGPGSGRLYAFDAKETNEDRLPLKNIHDHQYEFLKSWYQQGACSFLIVAFVNKFQEIYILPFPILEKYWEDAKKGGRKSIPYSEFFENCELVKSERGVVLDYIGALSKKGCPK